MLVKEASGNKGQRNFNQNTHIFFSRKAIENIHCKMFTILFQPEYVENENHSNVI